MKTVLVTGGARGIGKAIVEKFAKAGFNVILNYSKSEESAYNLAQTYENVRTFKADISNKKDVLALIEFAKKEFKQIDILVNNAGISSKTPLLEYTEEEFDNIINVNVKSVFVLSKVAVPYLKETKGVILNTSSMVSIYGQPSGVMYPASKFAVNGITKSLSRELAPMGIRVNAIAPGITETDMVKSLPKEMIEPLINSIPLKRIGTPKDIANAFVFLASDNASYITGTILNVDGSARS